MRQALTLALQDFEGAVIVVSHDRHLLRHTVDEFVLVADGRGTDFDGDLDDYYRWLLTRRQPEGAVRDGATDSKKAARQQAAARREQLKPLTNKRKQLERDMAKLEARLTELDATLADEALYTDERKDELKKCLVEQADLRDRLGQQEEAWLEVYLCAHQYKAPHPPKSRPAPSGALPA